MTGQGNSLKFNNFDVTEDLHIYDAWGQDLKYLTKANLGFQNAITAWPQIELALIFKPLIQKSNLFGRI